LKPVPPRLSTLCEVEAAVWRELARSAADKQHPWRTPVLATTDGDIADARTVVLREVSADEKRLVVYTDQRSAKVAHLGAHPVATLVMWSPSLGWQLRCRVRVTLESSGLAVSSRWDRVRQSPGAQDYLSPLAPGSTLGEPPLATGQDRTALPHFAVMDAQVLGIDWLELHPEGHRRALFDGQGARWLQP
jgi:pyridoxamine 5'-phosphate oxidase